MNNIRKEIENKLNITLNEMQVKALENKGKNIVLNAPTSSGKTIAILCNMKEKESYYYFLPTITSCHFMYDILKELHLFNVNINTSLRKEEYFVNEDMSTINICCPDATLIKYIRKEEYNFNLILDEIDNYPIMCQSVIKEYIKDRRNNEAHMIVASATLNKTLLEVFENFTQINYKNDLKINKHKTQILEYGYERFELENQINQALRNNKKIGIICNSIRDIEDFTFELRKMGFEENISVLHSNLPDEERKEVEDKLFNKDFEIIISNDIISYSVDVDFDLMITQPTDKLNLMIQRLGRNNRYNKDINETNLIIVKECVSVPFIDGCLASSIIEEYFTKDILTYEDVQEMRNNLDFEYLPTITEVKEHLKELEENEKHLALREIPYSFKLETRNKYGRKDFITFKRNEIPFNRKGWYTTDDNMFLFINGSEYIVTDKIETGTYLIEPVWYIDKYYDWDIDEWVYKYADMSDKKYLIIQDN